MAYGANTIGRIIIVVSTILIFAVGFAAIYISNRGMNNNQISFEHLKTEFDDEDTGNYYNYCPSYIQTDETTRYIFYCKNPDSNIIVDSIFMRKSKFDGEKWNWGEQIEVLKSGDGWESLHVCDPEVRKGEFNMNGNTYTWVMFYLGCDLPDYNHNQIGVAFANDLEGPWHKWEGNPLVEYPGVKFWGVGQPGATSIDEKGQLYLYYTRSDAQGWMTKYREVDLSDMSKPVLGGEQTMFTQGINEKDGSEVIFNNAGFAFDKNNQRIYTVRERHPYENVDCTFISVDLEVASTPFNNLTENMGQWKVEGYINPDNTGFERNHNPGFLTDPYGNLIRQDNEYQIAITTTDTGPGNLWNYRVRFFSSEGLNMVNKIDVMNQSVKYTGIWETVPDDKDIYYINSFRRGNQKEAKITFVTNDANIKIFGDKSPDGGIFKVYINGEESSKIDTYSKSKLQSVMLYEDKTPVKDGIKTVRIEITGEKNKNSTNNYVTIDYMEIIQ